MTVVDASVVIKWFAPEPDWETARTIADSDLGLIAPSHLVVETGRGLLRHHRDGQLSSAEAKRALLGLADTVSLIPTETLVDQAFEIAATTATTIYDALYVALAASQNDVLITADLRLVRNLAGGVWGRHVVSLSDWPSHCLRTSRP